MGESMNEEDVDVIDKTGEKLKELAPNVRLIQDDNTQNALLNGEASVAFLYTSQVTAALAENPDLKVVYPEEGLGFGIMGMFIPSLKRRIRMRHILSWITSCSRRMQQNVSDYIGYYSTNKAADDLVESESGSSGWRDKGRDRPECKPGRRRTEYKRTGLNLKLPAIKGIIN